MNVIYVSLSGNDQWSGLHPDPSSNGQDGPFATVHRAQQALRDSLRKGQPAEIQLRQGTYFLDEPLTLTAEDSGTAEEPVVIRAYAGENAILSGGRRISNWREGTVNGKSCWVAELPDVASGEWEFRQLFVNGERRYRPCLPKKGFHRFDKLAGENTGWKWYQGPESVIYREGDLQPWKNLQDVELVIYQLWFDIHHRIKSLDGESRTVHFHAKSLGSLVDEKAEMARYRVENVFEALEEPGEWYLDRPSGRVYYLPMDGETLENTEVIAPRFETVVEWKGDEEKPASHVHLENLGLHHAEWVPPLDWAGSIQAAYHVPGAVRFEHAEHGVLYGCDIAHVAQYGVQMALGSHDCRAVACAMHDLGAGGARIDHEWNQSWGEGEKEPEAPVPGRKPRSATVCDCVIHDGGKIYPSAIGIWIGNAAHNRIRHNHIFDMMYTGISCGWVWGYTKTGTMDNRIENNHIHHINWERLLSDNGGIYTLGIQPGTVVGGNYIHHISCHGYGGWGIYPDEGSSKMIYENNIVHHTGDAAYSGHYCRDLWVRNNLFACSGAKHVLPANRPENHRSGLFERNLIVYFKGGMTGLGYGGSSFAAPVSRFIDNLVWRGRRTRELADGLGLDDLESEGLFENTLVADPLFLDAEAGDFRLRDDSPALTMGFEPRDPALAGPRGGARRPGRYAEWTSSIADDGDSLDAGPVVVVDMAWDKDRACVDVSMTNVGDASAVGVLHFSIHPESAAKIAGATTLSLENLAPGAEETATIEVKTLNEEESWWLEMIPEGAGLVPALLSHRVCRRWEIPTWSAPEGFNGAFERMPAESVRSLGKEDPAPVQLSMARVDDHLLLWGRVSDVSRETVGDKPWTQAGIEFFVASEQPSMPTFQGFLTPDGEETLVSRKLKDGKLESVPEISTHLQRECGSYVFGAWIPMTLLPVSPGADTLRMELLVRARPVDGDNLKSWAVFEAKAPATMADEYGEVCVKPA